MPTNRRFRKTQVKQKLTEAQWASLCDDRDKAKELDLWETLFVLDNPFDHYARWRRLWDEYRGAVLDGWIPEFPGTRPSSWWRFDAPRIPAGRWPGCYWDGKLPQPRLQLRGSGSASWDAGFDIVPEFECGLPTSWVNIEPEDPPVCESQASYLKRHRLLTVSEERRLVQSDFEPEVMTGLRDDEFLSGLENIKTGPQKSN